MAASSTGTNSISTPAGKRLRSWKPRYANGEMMSKTQETLMACVTVVDSLRHAHHELAEILPREQSHEPARRVLESLDQLLAIADAAGAQPRAHVALKGREAPVVIEDDESLDADAPAQHGGEQHRRAIDARGQLLEVVPGDESAQRHARADVEERCDGVQHRAADVLEVHIDPLGTGGGKLLCEARAAVIDAGIEPEGLHRVAALLRTARHPDHATALELRNLPDYRAHRSGRSRHHHGVAGLRLADVEESDVGGESRHAEHAE